MSEKTYFDTLLEDLMTFVDEYMAEWEERKRQQLEDGIPFYMKELYQKDVEHGSPEEIKTAVLEAINIERESFFDTDEGEELVRSVLKRLGVKEEIIWKESY